MIRHSSPKTLPSLKPSNPLTVGIWATGFCVLRVSKGEQLWSADGECTTGVWRGRAVCDGGLELITELADNQKKNNWRVLLQSVAQEEFATVRTAPDWHELQFQHLYFTRAVRNTHLRIKSWTLPPVCRPHRSSIGETPKPRVGGRSVCSRGRPFTESLKTRWWRSWIDWNWKQLSAQMLKRNREAQGERNTTKKLSDKHCTLFCEMLYFWLPMKWKELMLPRREELHSRIGFILCQFVLH